MIFAPPWALFGGAIHSDSGDGQSEGFSTDPHLASGVHLRVLPSPQIGIPATPLFVSRLSIENPRTFAHRTDIKWFNDQGNPLPASFDLDANHPVTGWLPGPLVGRCIWIEVELDFEIIVDSPPEDPVVAAAAAATGVQMDARIATLRGQTVVGTRSAFPWAMAAPVIESIVIRPNAVTNAKVVGVRWIAAEDLPLGYFSPFRVWSLPIDPAPRYQPTATARGDADSRVTNGAPPHQPLHINPVDGGPSASPPATPADETARIARLSGQVRPRLERLANDLSAPPAQLSEAPSGFTGALDSSATFPLLGHVLQSALDPGMARWLGFGDVDPAPFGFEESGFPFLPDGALAIYLVRGLWMQGAGRPAPELGLLASALVRPGPVLTASFPQLASLPGLPTAAQRFYDLGILLSAVIGRPPDRPVPPTSLGIEDGGWRSDLVVPEARRVIGFPVSDLVPAAAIAFSTADQQAGGGVVDRPLNPRLGSGAQGGILRPGEPEFATGLPLPLAATVTEDDTFVDRGRFEDRDGAALGGTYRVGQADWFGRWGEWTHIPVAAWARTRPPAPFLELTYVQPDLPPTDLVARTGTFIITVPVPAVEDLPPGGFPLEKLDLTVTVNGVPGTPLVYSLSDAQPVVANQPVPPLAFDPAPTATTPGVLRIELEGPALLPGSSAAVSIVGHWNDTEDQQSNPSAPVNRVIFDPRPIPPPVLPTELIYAQRPDAQGLARVEIPFPSASPTCRVYFTTETTARAGLAALAASTKPEADDAATALEELDDADQGTARAQVFGRWKHLLDMSMFENLTVEPFTPAGASRVYPHALSGSLDNLALYRVLSVSAGGALSVFATSPLVAAMVPNFGPPARPLVQAAREVDQVRIEVRVPLSARTPVAFRVRRATVPYRDNRQMTIENSGTLVAPPPGSSWLEAPPTVDERGTVFTLIDPGPFTSWKRYFWSVEVQADDPPGAPTGGTSFVPPGEWSLPSSAAVVEMIPVAGPGAPDSVQAIRAGSDVQVTVTASGGASVIGTPFGAFQLELFRSVGTGRPVRVDAPALQQSATELTVTDPGAPANAVYTARIVDPLGRRGTPTSSSTPV